MQLPSDGREYASWTVTTKNTLASFEVQLAPGGPWFTAAYSAGIPDASGTYIGTLTLLVYGPSWPPMGSGIVNDGLGALVSADCQPRIVCTSSTEDLVRQAGWITLS